MRDTIRDQSYSTGQVLYKSKPSNTVIATRGTISRDRLDKVSDLVVPNYHERSANGEIFNNPYEHVDRDHTSGGGYMRYWPNGFPNEGYEAVSVNGGSISEAEAQWAAVLFPWFSRDANPYDIIKQNALAKMDSTPTDYLEDAFEIKQTLKFLRSPLGSLRDLASAFYRRKGALMLDGQTLVQAHANAWLTYRYAVRPLEISVTNAIANMHLSIATKERPPQRRVSRQDKGASNMASGVTEKGPYGHTYNYTHELQESYTAGILYEVNNPIKTYADFFGLRAKDIPATIYRVYPYSWFIDRFYNVGNAIDGLVNLADPSLRILAAWTSQKIVEKKSFQLLNRSTSTHTFSVSGDVVNDKLNQKTRIPWNVAFTDAFPSVLRDDQDLAFAADAASLILQRFSLNRAPGSTLY